ncbi:MAG: acyl-CoA dehydrogenase [Promethearchaeota archaeon]|nr:MAG: acyl-CoA dehydrogenase [Candidatus Lokiarchaeota archaeon]
MARKFEVQAINDEILDKLSLKNRNNWLNMNVQTILNKEQFGFLRKVQKFCEKVDKENDFSHSMDEDVYQYMPIFGKEGYISRGHEFDEIDMGYGKHYGLVYDMLRCLAVDFFDPQFNMSIGASTLCINPIAEHHDNVDIRLKIMKELVTGQAVGCILITEPERGSDATHMLTTCDENEDGSFTVNGTKIYNTNAPKSQYAVGYATTTKNDWKGMTQLLIDTSWDGWNCERAGIPWVPKLWLGKEELKDLVVPKEYVLGGPGEGRTNLFQGLLTERLGIAYEDVAQSWNAITHAAIYASMRKQFKKPIVRFQGVGFLLTHYWAQTANLFQGILKFCENYDEKYEKYEGNIPTMINRSLAVQASQLKYSASKLTERCCYEMANLMGGAGVCDNTLIHDLVGISRIQEIVGGTTQIQQYIMASGLGAIFKMI